MQVRLEFIVDHLSMRDIRKTLEAADRRQHRHPYTGGLYTPDAGTTSHPVYFRGVT